MSQIYRIEATRAVYELILKPFGTYLIRYSTENDDTIFRINKEEEIRSNPYLVLSVRVNEHEYSSPIMNYHLPSNDEDNYKCALEYYQANSYIRELPELIEECVIKTDDTDWKIAPERFQTEYMYMYQSHDVPLRANMKCDTRNGCNRIKIVQKEMKNNEQELAILQTLSYFHIVTFYGLCCGFNEKKYLILADHGDSLKSRYSEIKYGGDLMSKQLATIGYQIACGMMYLELKGIIHRDLHAENILMDEDNYVRITDFEHAIMRNGEDDQERELGFKKRRLAPECLPLLSENEELIDSNEILLNEFSSKSDVWAYGLIFIDLTIDPNTHIYPDLPLLADDVEETTQMIQYIKINHQIHPRPSDCPKNLYDLLKHCWEYCPEKRISFENIRNEMLNLFKSISK